MNEVYTYRWERHFGDTELGCGYGYCAESIDVRDGIVVDYHRLAECNWPLRGARR